MAVTGLIKPSFDAIEEEHAGAGEELAGGSSSDSDANAVPSNSPSSSETPAPNSSSSSAKPQSSSEGEMAAATASQAEMPCDAPRASQAGSDEADGAKAAQHLFAESFHAQLTHSRYASFVPLLVLGRGAQALAVLLHQGQQRVVSKQIFLEKTSPEEIQQVQQEVLILKDLCSRSRHIVQYLDCVFQPGALCLILEFADAGSLQMLLSRRVASNEALPTAAMHVWLYQLASALHIVHEARVLHRDIKTANILLCANGDAKLADFGLAKRIDFAKSFMASTACGTVSACSSNP